MFTEIFFYKVSILLDFLETFQTKLLMHNYLPVSNKSNGHL